MLEHLEREAGEARTGGLWADPKPVPPREGRKRSRPCNPMAEFSGFVANCLRFGQNLTERHRGCCQEVVALGGKLSAADPDGQRK